jgi:hypothetical protein
MRENATKASRCSKGRYRNRLTTQYTRTANPGIMLIRNPQESKLAHCEFNGKMGTPGLCPEVITAAARIKTLTQRGRENRTRETNFKPLITFSKSSRGSDRLLRMKFSELRQPDGERVRIFGTIIGPSTALEWPWHSRKQNFAFKQADDSRFGALRWNDGAAMAVVACRGEAYVDGSLPAQISNPWWYLAKARLLPMVEIAR